MLKNEFNMCVIICVLIFGSCAWISNFLVNIYFYLIQEIYVYLGNMDWIPKYNWFANY